jgi:hypothetical protein
LNPRPKLSVKTTLSTHHLEKLALEEVQIRLQNYKAPSFPSEENCHHHYRHQTNNRLYRRAPLHRGFYCHKIKFNFLNYLSRVLCRLSVCLVAVVVILFYCYLLRIRSRSSIRRPLIYWHILSLEPNTIQAPILLIKTSRFTSCVHDFD